MVTFVVDSQPLNIVGWYRYAERTHPGSTGQQQQIPRVSGRAATLPSSDWTHVFYAEDDQPESPVDAYYEKPTLTRLGTLGELTLGGDTSPDDMLGGAGDEGSL